MKKINGPQLLLVIGLILVTGAVMGVTARPRLAALPSSNPEPATVELRDGTITVRTRLVQDKVLRGSIGRSTLALTLQASRAARPGEAAAPVDLVVVLDRSGSMNGSKIQDARRAVLALIDRLAPQDRLGVVTYSNTAEPLSELRPMTPRHRTALRSLVNGILPGGGTNLGGGLETGLAMFSAHAMNDHHRKVLLISDGLANQGVTDPHVLGRMAAAGFSRDRVVSTVGLGRDFNEHLMTTLADEGGGTYTYLEAPAAFAALFQQEYRHAATTAVSGMTIRIPLDRGVQLIDAGGYPIETRDGTACSNLGGLRFGQTRTLHLTFQVPTDALGEVTIAGLQLAFRTREGRIATRLPEAFTIACVANPTDVTASIHKDSWAAQVVQDDFGRLKAVVADALREGDPAEALLHIEAYRQEKAAINQVVASPRVSENLLHGVAALEDVVRDTFRGGPETVMTKQKQNAKALQYEAYRERRDNR